MENNVIYLTQDGLEKLNKERSDLILKRPELVTAVKTTGDLGDISENAGYHAAKDELSNLDNRVAQIEEILKKAKVNGSVKSGVVEVGTKVKIKDSTGSTFVYEIVGVSEADPKNSKISYESPIGKALFKKKIGDKAVVQTPIGESTFEIINLE